MVTGAADANDAATTPRPSPARAMKHFIACSLPQNGVARCLLVAQTRELEKYNPSPLKHKIALARKRVKDIFNTSVIVSWPPPDVGFRGFSGPARSSPLQKTPPLRVPVG